MDLAKHKLAVKKTQASTKKFFDRLKRKTPDDLDERFHEAHETVFERMDCLTCANCCKTTGPLFTQRDIERLAHHLRMRPAAFTDKFLHVDEDGDWVLNTLPCPFLGPDNYCSVYEFRPGACREYPHTHQRKMHTILKETYNNVAVCPAVYEIVERLKEHYE
ncbi:MAG: YkgJ family cysteine cluster protein [Bacteroidota bacterium]